MDLVMPSDCWRQRAQLDGRRGPQPGPHCAGHHITIFHPQSHEDCILFVLYIICYLWYLVRVHADAGDWRGLPHRNATQQIHTKGAVVRGAHLV